MLSGIKQRIQNIGKKGDMYGDVRMISFLSTALSRLAYFNDNQFLPHYEAIMGPVFQLPILQAINSVPASNLELLLDDENLYKLNDPNSPYKNFLYVEQGKKYIDNLKLKMDQDINIINGEIEGVPTYPFSQGNLKNANMQKPQPGVVKYISIGWSDYGEIFVVADKRMPNTIFVVFRGTYSARTTYIYAKPSSLTPKIICPGSQDGFLLGMIKVSLELIHTTIEAAQYLATKFLGQTAPDSVKIITTGHSLGGALCTNFAYLWNMAKNMAPYNAAPYNVVAKNIACFSIAAPRSMNEFAANTFCNLVDSGQILYLRITTRGDPVPGLPNKTMGVFTKKGEGFMHPCSNNDEMRKEVSEDCNAQLILRPLPNVNYAGELNCSDVKTGTYVPNFLSHTIYLDIKFLNAVDIENFLKGIGTEKEVLRGPNGGERVRLILGMQALYKAIFFNLAQVQSQSGGFLSNIFKKPAQTQAKPAVQIELAVKAPQPAIQAKPTVQVQQNGKILEDVKMSSALFQNLINQMKPIQGELTPMQGQMATMPANMTTMPRIGCAKPMAPKGGRALKRHLRKRTRKGAKGRSRNRSCRLRR